MSSARSLALVSIGVVLGGALVGLAPFARYDYARVGTSDLQRVDRLSGRVEWAGDAGWWNMADRNAPIEAEAKRFGSRSQEIAEQARAGRIRSAQVTGRQITVYPKAGEPFEAYAAGLEDPRLADLVALLKDRGVTVGGA